MAFLLLGPSLPYLLICMSRLWGGWWEEAGRARKSRLASVAARGWVWGGGWGGTGATRLCTPLGGEQLPHTPPHLHPTSPSLLPPTYPLPFFRLRFRPQQQLWTPPPGPLPTPQPRPRRRVYMPGPCTLPPCSDPPSPAFRRSTSPTPPRAPKVLLSQEGAKAHSPLEKRTDVWVPISIIPTSDSTGVFWPRRLSPSLPTTFFADPASVAKEGARGFGSVGNLRRAWMGGVSGGPLARLLS